MVSNNIIALLLIIIILFIVTDYCRNKNSVEPFLVADDDETKINASIIDLKKERVALKTAIDKPKEKLNNKAEYFNLIKSKLNSQLQIGSEIREKQQDRDNNQLDTIKDKLAYLQQLYKYSTMGDPENKFNSVRSLQNGTKLSIEKIEGKPHYLVKLNNEKNKLDNGNDKANCLSVKSNGNYEIEECNENDPLQYFNLQNIPNSITYKNNLEKGILSNKNIPTDVNYPFNLIKSNHNKNCLQNFNNQISVTPCETKKSHRWEPLKNNIYCSRDEDEK